MTEHSFIVTTDFGELDRKDSFNVLHHVINSGGMNCGAEFLQKNFPDLKQIDIGFTSCIPEEIAELTSEQLLTHSDPLIRLIASQALKGTK